MAAPRAPSRRTNPVLAAKRAPPGQIRGGRRLDGIVLLALIVLGLLAVRRFHPEPVGFAPAAV